MIFSYFDPLKQCKHILVLLIVYLHSQSSVPVGIDMIWYTMPDCTGETYQPVIGYIAAPFLPDANATALPTRSPTTRPSWYDVLSDGRCINHLTDNSAGSFRFWCVHSDLIYMRILPPVSGCTYHTREYAQDFVIGEGFIPSWVSGNYSNQKNHFGNSGTLQKVWLQK